MENVYRQAERTALRRFFFAGGEQKPRGAVRVRKKVSVIFYQKRKNFSAARQEYFGGEDAKSGLSPGGGRQAVLLFFRGGMRCVTRNFLIARERLQCITSLCTNQLKIYTKLTDEDCAICVLQVEKQRYIFTMSFPGTFPGAHTEHFSNFCGERLSRF